MPRVTWDDLPASVRARVQRGLGALVVEHRSYPGGYSPGTADRVVAANGAVAFVKAVHPEQNPSTPALHLAELRVMRSLPPGLPVPALLDGFESDGWVVLVLEHVDGAHPAQPWRRDEFLAVVDAVLDLADRLTPSPLELGSAVDELRDGWQGWARCSANPLPDLDPWLADRLPGLNARAQRSLDAMDGDTLVHMDLRADNILLRDGLRPLGERVVLIDWPWAVTGARWLDATLLTAEVAAQDDDASRAVADEALERIAARCGVQLDTLVDAVVGLLGYLVWNSRQPDPPGIPTLRAFQRRLAEGVTTWVQRIGFDSDTPPSPRSDLSASQASEGTQPAV